MYLPSVETFNSTFLCEKISGNTDWAKLLSWILTRQDLDSNFNHVDWLNLQTTIIINKIAISKSLLTQHVANIPERPPIAKFFALYAPVICGELAIFSECVVCIKIYY